MTQCEVLYLAAVYLAYRGGRISRDECERLTSVMREQVPKAVAAVIADNNSKEIAEKIAGASISSTSVAELTLPYALKPR